MTHPCFEAWLQANVISPDEHSKRLMHKAWLAGYDAALDAAIATIRGPGDVVVEHTRQGLRMVRAAEEQHVG